MQIMQQAGRIRLNGDHTKDVLQIFPDQILYLTKAQNYVAIYHRVEGNVTRVLFRSTLDRLARALQPCSQFYRCHKKYLVNLNNITHISYYGATVTYLHVQGLDVKLRVARDLTGQVSSILRQLRGQTMTKLGDLLVLEQKMSMPSVAVFRCVKLF